MRSSDCGPGQSAPVSPAQFVSLSRQPCSCGVSKAAPQNPKTIGSARAI